MARKKQRIRYKGTREEWLTRMDEGHRCTLFIPAGEQHEIQKLVKEGWERREYRTVGPTKGKA
ncbi:conserved hypothetical protein [Exiguobacterium sp. 8H]|uniref:hypothetical protein n=1 Tax=unclassified Exiguobacterium TaxID=2644629 RepID=UPI0012F17101|nr:MULTISPECIES: hypothetical protein [unclassified Exiguobacterium]VXB52383.1 conserved hypothetical protein [Exiguobacterium sp. 8A]VXB53086.1 conserved hypothetical protein [Exiguobacterium sp. 8H]